MATTLIVT